MHVMLPGVVKGKRLGADLDQRARTLAAGLARTD